MRRTNLLAGLGRTRSRLDSRVYLGEAASDLHVLSSFHSLNALPMYIHYTSDSLSVDRLSLAYWQNMSDMCYQVESDIICSQNGQLSKHWSRYHVTSAGIRL